MNCLKPIIIEPREAKAQKTEIQKTKEKIDKEIGAQKIETRISKTEKKILIIPCGKCIICQKRRQNEIVMKNMLQMQEEEEKNEKNKPMFLSLTYREEIKTQGKNKTELQLFIKRLRKKYKDKKIKYFMCGEYGEKTGRIHAHAIILGMEKFEDERMWRKSKREHAIKRSETLEKIWGNGIVSIQNVTENCIKYMSLYASKEQKKTYKQDKTDNEELYKMAKKYKKNAEIQKEWKKIKMAEFFIQSQKLGREKIEKEKMLENGIEEINGTKINLYTYIAIINQEKRNIKQMNVEKRAVEEIIKEKTPIMAQEETNYIKRLEEQIKEKEEKIKKIIENYKKRRKENEEKYFETVGKYIKEENIEKKIEEEKLKDINRIGEKELTYKLSINKNDL